MSVMNDVEKSVKDYNTETATTWKIESAKLIDQYKGNKKDFEKVLHDVVGRGSGVLRNIKTEDFPNFAEYVRSNLSKIEAGNFDIFSVKEFSGKKPTSFISKICHIVNPKDYPLIWDANVRKALKIGESKKKWDDIISELKQKQHGKKNEDIYLHDSELWSGETV